MNARTRTIVILAAALVLLAGATFWLQSTPAAPTGPTPAPTALVWDNGAATASAITVQAMTQTVSLAVKDGKWTITAPTNEPADDLTVAQIVNDLKRPPATSKVADNPTDLAQYGLASPALTVTLVLSGATPPQQQLFVGKQTLDGSNYYVRSSAGQAVYLTPNTTIEPVRAWLTSPPVAIPTATPIPATIVPAPVITGTVTVTGTVTGAGETVLTPSGTTIAIGTEPPVGGSPVSSPPDEGPGASPVATSAGGGTGAGTAVVITPTP
jgi:hypothetical protein